MLHTQHPNPSHVHPHHHTFSPSATTIDPLGYSRIAVVTGCSSGIGLATTLLLLQHQFSVCGLDVQAFDYSLVRPEDHVRFHFHLGDLSEDGGVEEGVRVSEGVFGDRIDVLVNVAGLVDDFSSAATLPDDVWDRVVAVNLTAPVKMMRAVLPVMRARGDGVIVNVAGSAAAASGKGHAGIAYTASKHGLIGATKHVAFRFKEDGIRCNAVLPGKIDSGIGRAIVEGGGVVDGHAIDTQSEGGGPSITALEVARTILFLVSDHARTINGVSLPVDRAWDVI